MATLATILRKLDTTRAEPRRVEAFHPNPYQLRALPNEDIFFHRKSVDNSRLVREPDPRAKAECWSTIGVVCALAAVLITSLAPGVAGITAGYQIEALKQESQRLLNERRGLEVEEAKLVGPARLEQLARDQQMASPKADQIVNLNIKAGEGEVAFNAASSKEK
jgi:cell division protein FtsL